MLTSNIINEYHDVAAGKLMWPFEADSWKNGASTREKEHIQNIRLNYTPPECGLNDSWHILSGTLTRSPGPKAG